MERYGFPLFNGIVVYGEGKKVVSVVENNGQKRLKSFPEKNKIIFFHFPFARGLQYFFCGIFAFFQSFFSVFLINFKKKQKKDAILDILLLFSFIVLAVVFSEVWLGMLPAKLGYLIEDYDGSPFLRNVFIAIFKTIFFIIFVFSIRIIPAVNEFFRFNRAADIALMCGDVAKNKKKKYPNNPINFLNFIVFTFILDYLVITLIGASFGFWFNLAFHIAMFLLCISFSYEILNFMAKSCDIVKNIGFITSWLIYAKPSTTHIETAMIAITEMNLLCSQKDREYMNSDDKIAFSVIYNEVKNRLASAGITDRSETDWLIATVLGKNRAEIKLVSFISDKQAQEIIKATARRTKGESLDNIFGFTEFYGLSFDVNKKVLTPRMETEILVEQVLKQEKNFKKASILDVGTGSGAIAIAIAKNCNASVTALDISKMALVVAENNAKKNGVKIEFLHSNLFENLKRKRKFDIIVSNPPYIKTEDIKKLDKTVRECDPVIALDGGEDGLDFYRQITEKATNRLNVGGYLFYEVGKGQSSMVRKILRENGFVEIKTIKDYNKIERVVYGRYK